MEKFEYLIFQNLLTKQDYTKKILPFLERDWFRTIEEKIIFDEIKSYIEKYHKIPTGKTIRHEIEQKPLDQKTVDECTEILKKLRKDSHDVQWLLDKTEEWGKNRAIHNGILESITILDGKSKRSTGEIPKILTESLCVALDKKIGHEYFVDISERRTSDYSTDRIPFDIDILNKVTEGGLPRKTLNVLMGGIGRGKSLTKCHVAASAVRNGYNVLYITLELSQGNVGTRIDANILDTPISTVKGLDETLLRREIDKVKAKTKGRLFVKEYSTSSANANTFRVLIDDLKLKKDFVPDILLIDYINICSSVALTGVHSGNFFYIKGKLVAEELRALAQEYNLAILTSCQYNREGFTSSDPGLENSAESFGIPETADFMLALIVNDELKKMNQILFKQVKNRYYDDSVDTKFILGVDKSRMKLYGLGQKANSKITGSNMSNDDNDDMNLNDFLSDHGGLELN